MSHMGIESVMSSNGASVHDYVVKAAMRSYEIGGNEAVPYWEGSTNGEDKPDLLIPSLRRVEEVETEDTIQQVSSERLIGYQTKGLEVWILVPITKLGEAHQRLRGAASRVQPWWIHDGRICFGRPESL